MLSQQKTGRPLKSVALYLRVSTRDQKFASQEKVLREFCRRRGWKNLVVYSEKKSGADAPRTVLNQLMTDARAGKFDVIAVYKLDRFGRSVPHLMQLLEELKLRRIGFVSATEPIDTTADNPFAEVIVAVLSIIAKVSLDQIRERTRAGQAAAAAKGRLPGRPRRHDAAIAEAFRLKGKMSGNAIAKKLGLSPSYISNLFSGLRRSKGK